MNERRLELAMRRGWLQSEIDLQRRRIAAQAQPLAQTLGKVDGLADRVRRLREHPGLIGAAVAALVILRPRRLWRWGKRGLALWTLGRSLRGRLADFLARS
ncbi:hypothetical protein OTERR_01100 [Oryzomicrobium terrae]|uniref:YqjK-like protein n=1 Tax=Oryzomicrobium terrae TaxID=1735038 RepID=A0A5C1E3T7_9RHOO|nr:YqjK-like family protein [Oryzomicrobium terrae]QEL63586.1 hypothetical protein OTERR_01100 [Oryzomicrobium terrae]